MSKVHPGNGTIALRPLNPNQNSPYSVTVDALGLTEPPLSPRPWSEPDDDFRITTVGGWTYGWAFYDNGTYVHFAQGPQSYVTIDAGTWSAG